MKYKIIDITDNKGGSDGHIIMVKANPVKDAPGFAHLTKLFGKKYYTYSMMDDSETEIFVYPFSERLAHDLTTQAQNEGQKKDFWEPEDDDFYDADLMTEDGIKAIHKHISFKKAEEEKRKAGIQGIVDAFEFSESMSPFLKGGVNKITEVKNVSLSEGSVYSGKAIQSSELCIPNGYGYKIYKSEGNRIVASFFRFGDVGKVAYLSYPKIFMYLGGTFGEEPNGWGFKLARGQFTFGYYKDGKLYKELSPLVTDVYLSTRNHKIDLGHVEGDVNRLTFGVVPNEHQPFIGLQFLENGTVYIGECSNNNEYDLTGRFIRLKINGQATCGQFKNGEVVKEMSQEEYFRTYTSKSIGNERIDLSSNYLSKPNSGLYFIIGMQTTFDLDMGPILCVNAIPYETLEMSQSEHLNFDIKNMEYFYLQANENVAKTIKENSEKHRLWKVNMDDFNNHFGYVQDMTTQKTVERNFHLHNAIIGLEYTNVTAFDTMNVMDRIEERENL